MIVRGGNRLNRGSALHEVAGVTLASPALAAERFRAYGVEQISAIAARYGIPAAEVDIIRAVAAVFPFRVNSYVLDELIDWGDAPADPIYRLTFPQARALRGDDLQRMLGLVQRDAPRAEIGSAAREIRLRVNPHPSGQLEFNRPNNIEAGESHGLQHKYTQTVLFFPRAGQTCHAYCSYCFRWPQFIGDPDLKFAEHDARILTRYVGGHPEVTDVLVTGGDPLVMKTSVLARYVEPLLAPELDNVRTIRIGSKAPAYWPQRFVSDPDADALLALFERVVHAGKQLALVVHYSHPRELSTELARTAIRRVLSTGARIYCQAPLIRGVNDAASTWSSLWRDELGLGCTPYYMFVARDTGPRWLFEVPLGRAHEIFSDAYRALPGLARMVRGPVMSTTPGKVVIDGIAEADGERVFCLRFLQARKPEWIGRPFFAAFDPTATWFDQLRPAGAAGAFFFE